jgi:hypothetical protein
MTKTDKTNAERQRRYIERLKAKAAGAVSNATLAEKHRDQEIFRRKARIVELEKQAHGSGNSMVRSRSTPRGSCAACAEKDQEIARLKGELAQVVKVFKNKQGLMTTKQYKHILACLHPDRVAPELQARYTEAIMLWKELERIIPFELTFQERTGTPTAKMPSPMPRTTQELWEARQKVREERSARAKAAAAKRRAAGGESIHAQRVATKAAARKGAQITR